MDHLATSGVRNTEHRRRYWRLPGLAWPCLALTRLGLGPVAFATPPLRTETRDTLILSTLTLRALTPKLHKRPSEFAANATTLQHSCLTVITRSSLPHSLCPLPHPPVATCHLAPGKAAQSCEPLDDSFRHLLSVGRAFLLASLVTVQVAPSLPASLVFHSTPNLFFPREPPEDPVRPVKLASRSLPLPTCLLKLLL